MARPKSSRPTDVELQILNVLWQRGPSTVRQIHEALSEDRDTGYSTTLKMVQVMRDKGLVTRDDKVRPQVYYPAESCEETQSKVLQDLASRLFDGSARELVMRLVSDRDVSESELREIEELIAMARKQRKNS